MKIINAKDAALWQQSAFLLNLLQSLSFAAFALIVNYYAVHAATALAGPALPDFVLSRVPAWDTSWIDSYGALYLEYAVLIFAFIRTRSTNFFLKSMAVLILVRDVFVNMTNLGIPAGTVPTQSFFTQGGDLFFSGHTALPIMAALIYWNIPAARHTMLGIAALLGAEVLLGHQHYTIDVAAAPLIVYSLFVLCTKLFPADYEQTLS